jgi:hypothetical protein
MPEQSIIIEKLPVWWKVNRATCLRLYTEEHRRRRPRVVENPDRALAWIKARKFDPSGKCPGDFCLLSIAGMALAAADAINEARRHEAQQPAREIATSATEGAQP